MKDFALLDQQWEQFKAAWPVQPMPDEREARSAFYNLDPPEPVFRLMMVALGIHAASERWADPQFIPFSKNWIARRKFMDDPKSYPPFRRLNSDPNRCPECGNSLRVHKQFSNGRAGQRQAPDGSYCP